MNKKMKWGLRKVCRARRIDRHRRSSEQEPERLADLFLANVEPAQGNNIAGYWPIEGEMNVLPLLGRLHELGYNLCLPVVVKGTRVLSFRKWRPSDPTEVADFGIRIPVQTAHEVIPQLLIVPLIAFDERGYRLGHGGGYYDSTLWQLESSRPITVGVGFEDQRITEVPTEPHDVSLDWVITDERARRI